MYLSAVIGWPLFIAALMAVFICSWLATFALWPELVRRGAERYSRPFHATLMGLLIVVPGALAGAALAAAKQPIFKFVGVTALGAVFLIGLAGSAGLCLRVGRGLASPADREQPWRAVLRGGIVMAFVCLFPIIGWIGVLFWMLISGCGVIALSRGSNTRTTEQAPTEAPAPASPATPPPLEAGR